MAKKAAHPKSKKISKSWQEKQAVTADYIKWFVAHQSGDRKLAQRLVQRWHKGWKLALRYFAEGKTSADVAQLLKGHGYNVILVERGLSRWQLPGRTVTFLILDRENGAHQITLERWTATTTRTTNIVLTGMGQKDVTQSVIAEKQIHLCALELPTAGDYLDISTQSISPLLKGIIVFTAVTLLAGCTEKPAAPAPTPKPVAPPPAIPKDPTGAPGPHQVTSDNPADLPEQGLALPTGRTSGQPSNEFHKKPGVKSNISPTTPVDEWYWFWVFTVDVKNFKAGCCFYVMLNKKVWIEGEQPFESGWHTDTPMPGNIWVDADGLHFVDTPGYCSKGTKPPPYNKETGLGDFVGATDHVIIIYDFRIYIWCPGEEVHEYAFSKTLEIDKGVLKNGSSMEKPKFLRKRPMTDEDKKNAVCPQ